MPGIDWAEKKKQNVKKHGKQDVMDTACRSVPEQFWKLAARDCFWGEPTWHSLIKQAIDATLYR